MGAILQITSRILIRNTIRTSRVSCEYSRGDDAIEFEAGFGAPLSRVEDLTGKQVVKLLDDSRDLIVWRSDFTFDEPESGDRVVVTLPTGIQSTWEAQPFEGEPEWIWFDRWEQAYRIHVRRIEV